MSVVKVSLLVMFLFYALLVLVLVMAVRFFPKSILGTSA